MKLYQVRPLHMSKIDSYVVKNQNLIMSTAPEGISGAFFKRPWQVGFWRMPEKPIITIKKSSRIADRDLDLVSGFWIISDRCKCVLEYLDGNAFEFVKCECNHENGLMLEKRWLCAVIRVVNALDEIKTKFIIRNEPSWHKT